MIESNAVLSADRRYRYQLTRTWDATLGRVVWVLLNPSRADERNDDMTVTKCRVFATRWGYGGIEIVNLLAKRSSRPSGLRAYADPVGPENARYLRSALGSGATVVVGWGASIRQTCRTLDDAQQLEDAFMVMAKEHDVVPLCLGTTITGHPRHPSRRGYETPVVRWEDSLLYADPVAITP